MHACMYGYQENRCLVRNQLQDCVQVLVDAVVCVLVSQKGPTRCAQHTGCLQRCCFSSLIRFFRGHNLTLHHGKYVRALDAEDEPCLLPVPVTEVFGFLASVGLDALHGVVSARRCFRLLLVEVLLVTLSIFPQAVCRRCCARTML